MTQVVFKRDFVLSSGVTLQHWLAPVSLYQDVNPVAYPVLFAAKQFVLRRFMSAEDLLVRLLKHFHIPDGLPQVRLQLCSLDVDSPGAFDAELAFRTCSDSDTSAIMLSASRQAEAGVRRRQLSATALESFAETRWALTAEYRARTSVTCPPSSYARTS